MKIDKRCKYTIVLDTETTADKTPEENMEQKVPTKFIYDLGYTIATKNEIVAKRNWLVKEIYLNDELMNNAYFINKKPMYDEMLLNGEIELKPFSEIIKQLQQDIKTYNVKEFGAYNVKFDIDALMQTTNFIYPNIFKMIFKTTKSGKFAPDAEKFCQTYIFKKDIEIIDIWTLACQVLCNQKTFQAFYKQIGKRFIETNAEIVYNYITNQTDFEEDHTALSDSIIETKILWRIKRNHIKVETKNHFMPCHLVKVF